MNLKEMQTERDRLFNDFDEHMLEKGHKEVDLQGLASGAIEKRLAAGYIGLSDGGYRLELRAQRPGGLAHDFALEFAEPMGEHANVEVVTEIGVPPRTEVKEKTVCENLACRPEKITLGLSISHRDGSAGSIGGIVESRKGDGVLSAAHVIGLAGRATLEDWVYQPGSPDVEPLTAEDRIGQLRGFTEFTRGRMATMDAAYAVLEKGIQHDGNVLPVGVNCPWAGRSISGYATRKDFRVGMRIGKVGRTTCYTEGQLSAVGVMRYSIRTSTHGNLAFGNITEVTWDPDGDPFTDAGDSGSLYFLAETLKAVALHVAAGEREDGRGVSYGCDLLPMLKRLKLSLIGVPR